MLLFVWCMIGSSGGSLRWGSGSTMPETQLLSLCPSAVCLTCFLHHKMAGAGQVSPSIFLRNTKTFPEEAFTFLSLLRSGSHTHLLINSWPKVLRLCYPATARRLTRIEANITAAAFEKRKSFFTRLGDKETGGKTLKPVSMIQGSAWFLKG